MTDTKQMTDTARAQTLDFIKQGQHAVVQAVETWASTVERFAPDTVDFRAVTDRMPEPSEIIDGAFDFTEAVLATQREFTKSLLGAAAPAVQAAQRPADAAAADTASTGTKSTSKSTKS